MDLQITQKQIQTIAPQMIQSMELLQMNAQELSEYLDNVLAENPLLDRDEPQGPAPEPELAERLQWLYASDPQNRSYQHESEEKERMIPDQQWEQESLYRHLLGQLDESSMSAPLYAACIFLISSLCPSGWLDEPLPELARASAFPLPLLEQALEIIQSLDPVGVGARGFAHCLQLQLLSQEPVDTLAVTIAGEYLEHLSRHHYHHIAKALHCTEDQVRQSCQRIRALNPRPGLAFAGGSATAYVVPDILITREGSELTVQLYRDPAPSLHFNSYYLGLLQEDHGPEVKAYLNDRLKQATWLQQTICQRSDTILRCARYIAQRQKAFFLLDQPHPQPLTMAAVAEHLGVHESTVSRALKDKYLQCSRGLYPLSFFFPRRLEANQDSDTSAQEVKEALRRLIAAEEKPLSDEALSRQLTAAGYPISRRTVAKYRSQLQIPSASGRKH